MLTFLPRSFTKIPPFALISSWASIADCQISLPVVLDDPVIEATTPIVISSAVAVVCAQPAMKAATSTSAQIHIHHLNFIRNPHYDMLLHSLVRRL
jgi:hypothetical protein